jgi:hypothetical protein
VTNSELCFDTLTLDAVCEVHWLWNWGWGRIGFENLGGFAVVSTVMSPASLG